MLKDFRIPHVMIITSRIKSDLLNDLDQIESQILDYRYIGESEFAEELREVAEQKECVLSMIDNLESSICHVPRNDKDVKRFLLALEKSISLSYYEELKSVILENTK